MTQTVLKIRHAMTTNAKIRAEILTILVAKMRNVKQLITDQFADVLLDGEEFLMTDVSNVGFIVDTMGLAHSDTFLFCFFS